MKCLTTRILALTVTVTATVALAADYEILAPTFTDARWPPTNVRLGLNADAGNSVAKGLTWVSRIDSDPLGSLPVSIGKLTC